MNQEKKESKLIRDAVNDANMHTMNGSSHHSRLVERLISFVKSKAAKDYHSDEWIDIEDRKPIAYEVGNWDGKRSDLFLGQCKHGIYYIGVMYEGFLDGNNFCNFYDKNDYEIRNLIKWKPITD